MNKREVYLIKVEGGSRKGQKLLIWSTNEDDARKNASNILNPNRGIYLDPEKSQCLKLQPGIDYEVLSKRKWKNQIDIKGKEKLFISFKDSSDVICLMDDWPEEIDEKE